MWLKPSLFTISSEKSRSGIVKGLLIRHESKKMKVSVIGNYNIEGRSRWALTLWCSIDSSHRRSFAAF